MVRLRALGAMAANKGLNTSSTTTDKLEILQNDSEDEVTLSRQKRRALPKRFILHEDSDPDLASSPGFNAGVKQNANSLRRRTLHPSQSLYSSAIPQKETLVIDPGRLAKLSPRKAAQQIASARYVATRPEAQDIGALRRAHRRTSTSSSETLDHESKGPRPSIGPLTERQSTSPNSRLPPQNQQYLDLSNFFAGLDLGKENDNTLCPRMPKEDQPPTEATPADPVPPMSGKEHFEDANLDYSPPRSYNAPRISKDARRTVTAAQNSPKLRGSGTITQVSPSKCKLQSPSKRKMRVPSLSETQASEQFWDATKVNAWNDLHSPELPLHSTHKVFSSFNEVGPTARPGSPISLSPSSPTAIPTSKMHFPEPKVSESPPIRKCAGKAKNKAFDERKVDLAKSFLQKLDADLCAGRVASLAASSGGVEIIWSKTLCRTAGVARYSRMPKTPNLPMDAYQHHATIELAAKVITDDYRLYNTLAHEFCHLANKMISNVRDKPHGASFKSWGARCDALYSVSHNVHVTTKHTYEIQYKYAWECTGCNRQWQRHSKSIDAQKQSCGRCSGSLVQIRPVPRVVSKRISGLEGNSTGVDGTSQPSQPNGFAQFVKQHFAATKQTLPERTPHKEIMQSLSRAYHEEKAQHISHQQLCDAVTEDAAAITAFVTIPSDSEDDDTDFAELTEDKSVELDLEELTLSS